MSGVLRVSDEQELAFTEEDLAYLPDGFPPCLIRAGRIVRTDGLPLKWEDYQLLEEDFPAVLTKKGELEMAPAPTDTHEKSSNSLVRLLGHYLSCHPGGEVITNRELHIAGYHPAVPDLVFFRHPNQESRGKAYTDQIPDLTVEILSPSNKGEEWEDKCRLYRDRCPEVWFFHLDGNVEIWRLPESDKSCKPGEFFSSPLFPGLAIDPDWIRNYPEEVRLIGKFSPQISVLTDPDEAQLTKRAQKMAARIAEYFGQTVRSPHLQSEISREAGRRPDISQELRARRQHEPGREHER
jgi:Uma2 family endonuclease